MADTIDDYRSAVLTMFKQLEADEPRTAVYEWHWAELRRRFPMATEALSEQAEAELARSQGRASDVFDELFSKGGKP